MKWSDSRLSVLSDLLIELGTDAAPVLSHWLRENASGAASLIESAKIVELPYWIPPVHWSPSAPNEDAFIELYALGNSRTMVAYIDYSRIPRTVLSDGYGWTALIVDANDLDPPLDDSCRVQPSAEEAMVVVAIALERLGYIVVVPKGATYNLQGVTTKEGLSWR